MSDKKSKDRLLQEDIVSKAQDLVKQLESGDVSAARSMISTLNEIREDSLFNELGKLTRELHESIKGIDVGGAQGADSPSQNKLSYVMELTEKAANTTMDGIENTIPISDDLAKESQKLLEEWGRLGRREMSAEEFRSLYKEMMSFLKSVEESSVSIHDKLQEVLVAQNYQDLTGQAIKKVIDVVSDVERRLVHLIAITAEAGYGGEGGDTGSDDEGSGEAEVKAEVSGQDEVDDLLSSLGF